MICLGGSRFSVETVDGPAVESVMAESYDGGSSASGEGGEYVLLSCTILWRRDIESDDILSELYISERCNYS